MRLVLDTNVLVRAIISPTGLAAELWRRIRREHLLVLSAPIVLELSQVLGYDRVRRIHGLDDRLLGQLVDEIVSASLFVALPTQLPQVVPDHPADDAIVATAVQGGARVICTRNIQHLGHPQVLEYCRVRNIEVLDDLELLPRL